VGGFWYIEGWMGAALEGLRPGLRPGYLPICVGVRYDMFVYLMTWLWCCLCWLSVVIVSMSRNTNVNEHRRTGGRNRVV
jgi:hypothetical protein